MSPWDLVFDHQYGIAIQAYNSQLEAHADDNNFISEMATAYLCNNQLGDALAAFRRAAAISSSRIRGSDGDYVESIATVYWLMQLKREAQDALYRVLDGITAGSIKYADLAGGVSPGLLLWYMGVTQRESPAIEHSLRYLKHLASKSRAKYYPGPIAHYILGELPFSGLLWEAAGSEDLRKACQAAKHDLLKRRQLCQALFYDAVLARSKGDEEHCARQMRTCFALENPILESEWYLARAECNDY